MYENFVIQGLNLEDLEKSVHKYIEENKIVQRGEIVLLSIIVTLIDMLKKKEGK